MPFDLDVETPDDVAPILRHAAEAYYESHETLQEAHQDKKAGKIWIRIAAILETSADKIEAQVKKL